MGELSGVLIAIVSSCLGGTAAALPESPTAVGDVGEEIVALRAGACPGETVVPVTVAAGSFDIWAWSWCTRFFKSSTSRLSSVIRWSADCAAVPPDALA